MSRIGKKPIDIPVDVAVSFQGSEVTVKGPKGVLTQRFHPDMKIEQDDGKIVVTRPTDMRHHKSLHGLTRSLINNMVTGVSQGYEIRLEIIGTGYRAELIPDGLKLSLGHSHDILVVPPSDINIQLEDRGRLIILNSPNRALIGQVAADIRRLRPPEPYHGKGIRYSGEAVRQKAGKAGKVGG
ncbi:MAG: 50S ribosomal protein L6 [Anaerolineae bacterium]|nr:50S ribosomal protein L6 [Anaerolineae bacterium]